jgi:hypothetical protein
MDIYTPRILGSGPIDEAEGNAITIKQLDIGLILNPPYQSLDVLKGEPTQSVSALFSAAVLLGNLFENGEALAQIAYRNTAYVFISKLELEDFGNRIPTLVFEVMQAESRTAGGIIGDILEDAGLTSIDYDTTGIDDILVKGYILESAQSAIASIRPLLRAYNIVVQEAANGVLKFIKRGDEVVTVVDADDLAAHEIGQEPPRKISITDISDHQLPSEVNVQYFDPKNELQVGSQREKRINFDFDRSVNLDLPLTLNSGEARSIAARELWLAWTNRQKVVFTLPPSYIRLREQSLITVTIDSIDYRIIITRIDRGRNFLLTCEGFVESAEKLNFDIPADLPGPEPPQIPDLPIPVVPGIVPMAPLTSGVVGGSGLYLGVSSPSFGAIWNGADVYLSTTTDETAEYEFLGTLTTESIMGFAKTVLGDGRHGYIDRANSVQVEMFEGSLSSATANQVYDGVNIALLGDEIIGSIPLLNWFLP